MGRRDRERPRRHPRCIQEPTGPPRTIQEIHGKHSRAHRSTQEAPSSSQEGPSSSQEAPSSSQEAPRMHPGDTQTPRGHPEAPRAPEVILSENLPKPLSFTAKMAANTYFVREWRRRHAPFPQPAHKNEVTQCAHGAAVQARPLYQHRKNPYR